MKKIFPAARDDYLKQVADELNADRVAYELDTVLRRAHFFAQVRQEGGAGLQAQLESWNYSPASLKATFKYYRLHPADALTHGYERDAKTHKITRGAGQETIGNNVYASRNGNGDSASGDGWNFRGRGLIQVTGRSNYADATRQYRKLYTGAAVDFETTPELMADFPWAVRSAACFWIQHDLHTPIGAAPMPMSTASPPSSTSTPTATLTGAPTSTLLTMRSSKGRLALALLALMPSLLLTPSRAAPVANPAITHCAADERVEFSCRIGVNTVSLCAAGKDRAIAWLAYRYGVPGKVENEFLARSDNTHRFYASVAPAAPSASVRQVWFDRGGLRYLLTECIGGNCPKRAGLAVLRGDHAVMNACCVPAGENDLGWFSRDLVSFGADPASSQSATDLLLMQDTDNMIDTLYRVKADPLR